LINSAQETLEADVIEENADQKHGETDQDEVALSDVAVTAEFDYIDLDDDSEVSEAESADEAEGSSESPEKKNGVSDGPITRALHDFDSLLDDEGEGEGDDDGDLASANRGSSLVTDPNLSSPGGMSSSGGMASSDGWGFDQPQVSGVFSRYEEETSEAASDEFDLFEDDEGEEPRERTLQDIVNAHEKQMRRLEKRLVYQKEVIQVVSEMLVEASVVSKRELKKRLRALRDK
jgi:uncharacterized coiled-coil protein SlyX